MKIDTQDKFTVVIVDDDEIFSENLKHVLTNNGYDVVATINNPQDFIQYIEEKESPDILILDVFLGQENILTYSKADILGLLKDQNIVFITSSEDILIYEKIKDIESSFLIIKPFHFFTLDRLINNLLKNQSKIPIKDGRKKYYIEKKQVLCFEVRGNYSILKTIDKQYIFKKSLKQILQTFHNLDLVQVHRNYVVPKSKIYQTNFREKYLTIDSIKIPLSSKYKDFLPI